MPRELPCYQLKGYLLKLQEEKTLLGCALYVDALKAPSLLNKALQGVGCYAGPAEYPQGQEIPEVSEFELLQRPSLQLVHNRLTNTKELPLSTSIK